MQNCLAFNEHGELAVTFKKYYHFRVIKSSINLCAPSVNKMSFASFNFILPKSSTSTSTSTPKPPRLHQSLLLLLLPSQQFLTITQKWLVMLSWWKNQKQKRCYVLYQELLIKLYFDPVNLPPVSWDTSSLQSCTYTVSFWIWIKCISR
jgi:hypothetical protein